MANEFDKRVEDGENIWTCRNCQLDIRCRSKPRNHACNQHDVNQRAQYQNGNNLNIDATTSTPTRGSAASAPPSPFLFPPPPDAGTPLGARMVFPPGYQQT